MRYLRCLIAGVSSAILCLHLGAGSAQAEKRMALAVGIDVYDNLPGLEQLQKAVNDARAMGTALRELGFEVEVEANLPKVPFTRAWQRFLNRLEPGDTAALFFAGHGVEIGGLNYLLPRDVPKVVPGEDQVLAAASIRFNDLMDNLRDRKVRVSLFIVDACRDNPFRDGSGRSVGGTRGLVRVEPAEGTFVMYSAGVGQQALDRLPGADLSQNSVYTRTLLPILKVPGLSLRDIAGRVQDEVIEVARAAGRKQTPAYYDQAAGKLVLKVGVAGDGRPPIVAPQSSEAERTWDRVKDTTSIAVLEAFRLKYGAADPVYDRLAEARITDLRRQQAAISAPKAVRPAVAVAPDATLQPGRVFRDCPDVCPEMVVVPAGSFMMGSPESEKDRNGHEGPQRKVTIARPFAVGKFEVTFGEWDACVTALGCTHRPSDNGLGRGKLPVVNVSWDDITNEYLPWLARTTGRTYRLPTEAEWEYSARGVTSASLPSRRYWWGDEPSKKYANYSGAGSGKGIALVGQFPANPFGLHDMHGNVTERVEDCYNINYSRAPVDGSAATSGRCDMRVYRDGTAGDAPMHLRSANRGSIESKLRVNVLGFRVARTLDR